MDTINDGRSFVGAIVSHRSTVSEPTEKEQSSAKRREIKCKESFEDQYISAAGSVGLHNTSASAAVERRMEKISIESEEMMCPQTTLPALTDYPLLQKLIDNPLLILDDHNKYIIQLREAIEHTSFEQQQEQLELLLGAVNKQKYNSVYCDTYDYTNLHKYTDDDLKLDESYLAKTKYDQLVFLINTQIDAIKAEKKLIQEMKRHNAFNDFDFDNLWKLVIDHKDHHRGKYAYENEAGYLKGYFAGLTFVLEKIRNKTFIPNRETLRDLNQIMTDQVEDHFHIPIRVRIKTDSYFADFTTTPTQAYIEQLENSYLWEEYRSHGLYNLMKCKYYRIFKNKVSGTVTITKKLSCDTIAQEIEDIHTLYKEFEEKLKAATTKEAKELAIIFYLTNLDRMHLWADGNMRSITVLWMGIRMMNDFDLIMMNNPNDLDAHSDTELLQKVKSGTMNFKSLLKRDAVEYKAWDNTLNTPCKLYQCP